MYILHLSKDKITESNWSRQICAEVPIMFQYIEQITFQKTTKQNMQYIQSLKRLETFSE